MLPVSTSLAAAGRKSANSCSCVAFTFVLMAPMPSYFALLLLAIAGESPSDVKSRILDYRQYAKLRRGVPYVLEFHVGEGTLLLYGGRHVFDPDDPQVHDILKEWGRFKPTAAFNEGGDPPTEKEAKAAIERYGEAGLVRYLAARHHVPVATFEPARADELQALARRYTPEQVKVFYVLRGFLTFRRTKQPRTVEQFMANALLDPVWDKAGLGGPPRVVKEFGDSCARLFPTLKDWKQVPDDWFDPTRTGRFTNDAQNDSGVFRDRHIFDVLVEHTRKGERVFAVIGASHVPVLEPALVAALGKPARKRDGEEVSKP